MGRSWCGVVCGVVWCGVGIGRLGEKDCRDGRGGLIDLVEGPSLCCLLGKGYTWLLEEWYDSSWTGSDRHPTL